jgi:hypothetical protein
LVNENLCRLFLKKLISKGLILLFLSMEFDWGF